MSMYAVGSGKNILNTSSTLDIDVNTRNPYNATLVGYLAGANNRGILNTLIGYSAGNAVTTGMNNTMVGGNAGLRTLGADNVIVGTNAAASMRYGSRNIVLGSSTARNLQGNNNIFIGNANNVGVTDANHNIGIGANQFISGDTNITIGQLSRVLADNSISIGNQQVNTGEGSVIIGNSIANSGVNALIMNTYGGESSLSNVENNYTNINGFLVNYNIDSNATPPIRGTLLQSDLLTLRSSNLQVYGLANFNDHVTMKTLEVSSNIITPLLHLTQSNSIPPHWSVFLEPSNNGLGGSNCSDMIFKSVHGTYVTFTDDFASEMLNFTGKHRCGVVEGHNIDDYREFMGRIVSSCGTYHGLDGNVRPTLDESIPRVKLCCTREDPTAFGVVGGIEEARTGTERVGGTIRFFRLGNMRFESATHEKDERKLIVHSHGEGGMWVCDTAGPLKNGDLITSSGILGFGMLQQGNIVRASTVAKVTCDCNFDIRSSVYECRPFKYRGKMYKKAFVGCIFKF